MSGLVPQGECRTREGELKDGAGADSQGSGEPGLGVPFTAQEIGPAIFRTTSLPLISVFTSGPS